MNRPSDTFDFRAELALVPPPAAADAGQDEADDSPADRLDSPEMDELHGRLLQLYQQELHNQDVNRQEMAVDAAFYDGKQWTQEDARAMEKRGQVPIVYNQIKPVINWLCGNEMRNRMDFKVVGRGPEDAPAAEIKTALLKYLADVNTLSHHQSEAFRDAIKVGVGWLEDGVQYGDDGEELYSRHVNWRELLYDSRSRRHDLGDCRYLFRHGYYDVDMVVHGFGLSEQRYRKVLGTARGGYTVASGRDAVLEAMEDSSSLFAGRVRDVSNGAAIRTRVLLIEAWYRVPEYVSEFRGGAFHRQRYDQTNPEHVSALQSGHGALIQRMRMSMRVAILSEGGLLWEGPSPYRHNSYPYTPVWCYRDDESGLPYGMVRDMRDMQYDVNKRASKALYILSTNKVLMEKGAVEDLDAFAEEVARPDAILEYEKGYRIDLNVDRELAPAHLDMLRMTMQQLQSTSGVTDEQLGRTTNAVSGAAISARQDQGALQTASIVDSLRHARQLQGQKVLANVEQFMSEAKVIRITNARNREAFLRINDPLLPESVLAASQADFIIADTPQSASTRLAQAEQLSAFLQRMPPDVAVLFLPALVDLMDIPDKETFVQLLRSKLAIPDPDSGQDPAQARQQQEAMRQQQWQAAQQELQLALLQEKLAQSRANTANLEARTVRERVAALGDAVKAAAVAVQNGHISPTADDMLASAGFADQAAAPAPAGTLPVNGPPLSSAGR